MTKDYQVNYINNSGNETEYFTLASDIKTAISYTERLADCKEILSVISLALKTNFPTDEDLSKMYQNRADEG